MAEYVTLFHRWHDTVEQMQVRTADRAGGDLDDGIAAMFDLGIRHPVASNLVLAMPGQRFHPNLLAASGETNAGKKIGSFRLRNEIG
jgi:hypothetical protein